MALKLYDKRMLDLMNYLKSEEGLSNKDFLESIGFIPYNNIHKVKSGLISFTIKQVDACIKRHKVNPAYFFDRKTNMYITA